MLKLYFPTMNFSFYGKTRPCEQGNWETWMVLDPWNQV